MIEESIKEIEAEYQKMIQQEQQNAKLNETIGGEGLLNSTNTDEESSGKFSKFLNH